MDAREIWHGNSLGASLTRAALTPLSWLYAGGWQTYLWLYRSGFKQAAEPHSPVLCVGNLLIGGAGKSPMTVYLAQLLTGMGRNIVISASGYGGTKSEAATIAPSGPIKASVWGDEPAMLRWLLPDIPIIVGRRRVLAAELCHQSFPDAVMLMDDGFQHLPLKKHVTVLLDPESTSNARTLPAGPYREPRSNRNRADIVIPGRFQISEEGWFEEPLTSERLPVPSSFSVLCALGQPDRFLRSLPVEPVSALLLADHDPLSAGTLFESLPKDLPVVVTAKDWVKLRERPDLGQRHFLVARHSVRVEPEEQFRAWLKEKLDESKAA